ncbi:MAG: hypothetical protein ACYDHH_11230 [Solirubrobacteraceae bacterium]
MRLRSRWTAVAGASLLVVLFVLTELVVPPIAADRLRTRLQAHGMVERLSISAFPAIELLWGSADSVLVRMGAYDTARIHPGVVGASGSAASSPTPARVGPARKVANFLVSTAATDQLDASAQTFRAGRLVLVDVTLTKRGSELAASGLLTAAALRAAVPSGYALTPLPGGTGGPLLRGSVHILGETLSLDAGLRIKNGGLVLEPDIVGFFPSFLSLSVFNDPRIRVQSIGVTGIPGGWRVSATGELTGS